MISEVALGAENNQNLLFFTPLGIRADSEQQVPAVEGRMQLSDMVWTGAFSLIIVLAVLGNSSVLWVVLGIEYYLGPNCIHL